jgi:hypothetical protein
LIVLTHFQGENLCPGRRSAAIGVFETVLPSLSVTACSSDETAPAAGTPVPASAASAKTVLDPSVALTAGP